jgi:hypothetical protein
MYKDQSDEKEEVKFMACTLNKEDFLPVGETNHILHDGGTCKTCQRTIGHHDPRGKSNYPPPCLPI